MELAVNGRFLSQPFTGVQRVAFQYTQEIMERYPSALVFTPPGPLCKEAPFPVNTLPSFKPYNLFWEQGALPKAARGRFLLNFGNTAPAFVQNQALMLHDTAFLEHPQWFSRSFTLYYRTLIPLALRNARFIMTVSAFSKSEILKHFSVPPDKIHIFSPWAEPLFEGLRLQTSVSKEPYILAVASLEPRKNYPALLRAFARMDGLALKAAGGAAPLFARDPEFSGLSRIPNLELLGRCGDEELAGLYQKALFFCSLSFYEGFGLPPLEAMNAGCPLLLSDIAPHREVCGKAALYADPYDSEDILKKMKTLKENPSLREELALAGKERAALFRKERSAEAFFQLLSGFLG